MPTAVGDCVAKFNGVAAATVAAAVMEGVPATAVATGPVGVVPADN